MCRCGPNCDVHGITTSTSYMVYEQDPPPINEIVVDDEGEHIPEGQFPK